MFRVLNSKISKLLSLTSETVYSSNRGVTPHPETFKTSALKDFKTKDGEQLKVYN